MYLKRLILLPICMISISGIILAQPGLSISPNSLSTEIDVSQFETMVTLSVKNSTDSTVTFKWIRTIEYKELEWDVAIGDINALWSPTVNETPAGNYISIPAGDSTSVSIHVRPAGVEGSARIILNVVDVDNNSNGVEGSYQFNSTNLDVDLEVNKNIYINGDLPSGLIMKDELGDCWKLKVSSNGSITTTKVSCPNQ